MSATPGSQIAGYRVVELLGSGGMGDVYVVENEQLQRREAMKVISVSGASNPDFQQRFSNEARTAASLDHPSIITVHSYGVADGLPWFTMSYVRGPDLASTTLSPADAVLVLGQVADGLDYAHARTVIHRDIKPANIVITRNDDGSIARAIMLDFGIAKLADSPQLTAVNSVVGTAAYTAPEIISGQHASALSDQYSLACTAYELFAGGAPFKADTTTALMMAHIQTPPPMLGQARPDLAPLGPVLARAMAKDPAARFSNCQAFTDELKRAFAQTQLGTATAVAVPKPSYQTPAPQTPAPQTPAPQPFHPQSAPTPTPPPYGRGTMTPPPVSTPPPSMQQPAMQQSNPSHPGMVQPGFSQPGMSQPGMVPPVGAGMYAPGGGHLQQGPSNFSGAGSPPPVAGVAGPAWVGGAVPPTKKSKKGLWVALSLAAIVLLAVAATTPLWLFKGESAPAPLAFPESLLAVESGTACAVQNGDLFCWGDNEFSQIGDGGTGTHNTPVKVPGLTNVTAVSIGNYRSKNDGYPTTACAIADGDVYCWGANRYGQVGDGSTEGRQAPVKVPGLGKSTAIRTAAGTTCAVSVDKELFCWGSGEAGMIGTGNTAEVVATPQKVTALKNVSYVAGDGSTMCAIAGDDNSAYCWGGNDDGQIGNGTTTQTSTPVKVQNLKNVTSISVGGSYDREKDLYHRSSCAVADGKVYCWGNAVDGPGNRTVPVEVSGIEDPKQVSVDVQGACVVDGSAAQCWGNNTFGQLGNGNTEDQMKPTPVTGLTNVKAITTGQSSTCAMDESNEVYCWGASSRGNIGNSSADAEKQTTPLKVTF
ncbi:protein kinase domain-containing protein [Gordonia sp. (in: high G+C Gram-positive bacteria)]|uniref:protein kinase domain-containing protein n=1 Tax=Gordonia sp. (in: high G+C Gram-positive bacteria) TaxID=84139 RepID=UPI003C70C0CC